MNSEAPDSSHAFAEIAINKMEKQDKKIQEIETLLQKQIAHNAEIKQLVADKNLTVQEIANLYPHREKKVIETTRWLLDQGEIYSDKNLIIHLSNSTK